MKKVLVDFEKLLEKIEELKDNKILWILPSIILSGRVAEYIILYEEY